MQSLQDLTDQVSHQVSTRASEWFNWAHSRAQPYLTITGPGVKPTLPPKAFFKFPPSNIPAILLPPTSNPNSDYPFEIPIDWYNALLSPNVPITFALVYATVITYLNSVNRRRNKKPWAISQTRLFTFFVFAHNVFLSLYSLWTFVGMYNAMRTSVVNPRKDGLAATMDSLCKLHGPRGHGSAATFNEINGTWSFTDRLYRLAKDGVNPDATDVGRIWNEGLAYYGWIFYISKFYEVVDTFIIIAKGKTSSFLQMYHHAGAMLCMWAGIRYMSPPIWMFVLVNSFIHHIMYLFYTITTIGVRVPKGLKQTLTTMQIAQFVVGVIYAFSHYFVAYEIPLSVPYIYHFGEVIRESTPSIKSDASSALSVATATASADLGSWLKKLALRAAGREGLAENVENQLGQTFGIDTVHAAEDFVRREETRYRNEFQWVHCLDTSGQTFAIWLNIFYLAPLTWLFAQFFIKSYLKRVDERRRSSMGHAAIESINDARKGVTRRLSEAFEDYQGASGEEAISGEDIRKNIQKLAKIGQRKGEEISQAVSEKASNSNVQNVKERVQQGAQKVKSQVEDGVEKVGEAIQQATPSKETKENVQKSVSDLTASAKKSVENLVSEDTTSNAADTAEKVKEEAQNISEQAAERVKEIGGKVNDEVKEQKNGNGKNGGGSRIPVKSQPKVNTQDAQKGKKAATEKSTTPEKQENSDDKMESANDATVQPGKSFAEAAAVGVPEEAKGETVAVEDTKDPTAGTEEADEGA